MYLKNATDTWTHTIAASPVEPTESKACRFLDYIINVFGFGAKDIIGVDGRVVHLVIFFYSCFCY